MRPAALMLAALCVLLPVLAGCGVGGGGGPTATPAASPTPEGTIVTSDDGRLTLRIPLGAMPEGTQVSITSVPLDQLPAELQVLRASRAGYRLEPDGLRFEQPVAAELTLDYAALEQPENTASAYALVSFNDTEGLEILASQDAEAAPDAGTLVVRGELTHLSFVGVTQGSLELRLERVAREHPVSSSFTAVAGARNVDPRRAQLEEPEGVFGASGKVSVGAGSERFIDLENVEALNMEPGWQKEGTFDCAPDPGPGTYSVSMRATSVVQGPNGDQIRTVLRMAIRYDVECVDAGGGPTDTPEPGAPTATPPPGAAEVTVTIRTGCEHTMPGVESEFLVLVIVRFTDAEGKPAAGVTVDAEAQGPGLIESTASGTTDANGEVLLVFRINQFGQYTVTVLRLTTSDGQPASIAEGTTLTSSFQVRETCAAP